jgi:hypothetical protein
LIWCQRRPAIAASLPGAKPDLTCVFCPESDARMAATSPRRVVTRTSVDGGRASRFTRRNKPLNRAFPSRGGTIGDDCCGSGCHRLVTSGRRTRQPGRFPRAGSVCCVEQAQEASGHDVIAMSRWYQRGALGRRVRCVVSVNVNQSGARDAGGLAGWLCGSRCAAARRSRCAPGRFVLIGLVAAQRHARGDGGGLCVVFHLDSVDRAAPRVGDLPASGTYTAGTSPALNARVDDRAGG